MSKTSEKESASVEVREVNMYAADDARLAELGYRSEFKREFSVRLLTYTSTSKLDWRLLVFAALRDNRVLVLDYGHRGVCVLDPIVSTGVRWAGPSRTNTKILP
jgi:hypothetical protein